MELCESKAETDILDIILTKVPSLCSLGVFVFLVGEICLSNWLRLGRSQFF